jgi:hypothetical protein
MKRFQVLQSKSNRCYVVIDKLTGRCYLETENELTANKKANELNFLNEL